MFADSENEPTFGKPGQSIESQRRAFKRRLNETMMKLWQAIVDAEAEGHRLERQAEAARKDNDPDELARVDQAQHALADRINHVAAQMQVLSQQLDVVIETLDEATFQACVRQFQDQFGGSVDDVH